MSVEKPDHLNSLQKLLPEGLVATAAWLHSKGYSYQLLRKYVQRGWLTSLTRGVYRRPGPPLKWQHVVGSLQNLLELPVHVGGLTALEIQGKAHFLRLSGAQTIHLYSLVPLPPWVFKLPLQEKFIAHREQLFANEGHGHTTSRINVTAQADDPLRDAGLTQIPWGPYDWPITYSTLERAFLEFLNDVPRSNTASHARLVLQGLTTLSPRRLTRLLSSCRSVKVKRLFFALAERNNHQWLRELDPKSFDLGTGKRQLEPGGKLDPKYQITLPVDLDDSV